jgi:two-component sensor histidine kinase
MALAGAYDLLLADSWTAAELSAVIEKTLAPHIGTPDQLDMKGPACRLPSQLVLALSLVLHELATNAVKYGSLSVATGRIMIRWAPKSDGSDVIALSWIEVDGPPVAPPTRQGFGTKLLVRAFQSQFHSRIDLDYAVSGLECLIEFQVPAQLEDVAEFPT